ncbi:MAG: hypothetical protein JSR67_12265 [Proteobacteria bacterium]|nr:hypothetical protein [Pseudomonadota bacterium]
MTPEIRAFEFALGLFSVLIGLAIADVAASLHRLMRAQPRVRWDPLALLSALFAMVITVGMWFDLWGIRNATSVRHFFQYLALVGGFFVLFLIAASSLPDEASEGVDLQAFYGRNRRYFWSLVTLFEIFYVAFGMHFLGSEIDRVPRVVLAMVLCQWAVLIVVPAVLMLVPSRTIHYAGLALLFATVSWHYALAVIA